MYFYFSMIICTPIQPVDPLISMHSEIRAYLKSMRSEVPFFLTRSVLQMTFTDAMLDSMSKKMLDQTYDLLEWTEKDLIFMKNAMLKLEPDLKRVLKVIGDGFVEKISNLSDEDTNYVYPGAYNRKSILGKRRGFFEKVVKGTQKIIENTIRDLPQIVVVGSQSSGKSSVLENIVGRDFLPRGCGIVTRRPLILQLIYRKPKNIGCEPEISDNIENKSFNALKISSKSTDDGSIPEIKGESKNSTGRKDNATNDKKITDIVHKNNQDCAESIHLIDDRRENILSDDPCEYFMFGHSKKIFTDFEDVKKEILAETQRELKNKNDVSPKPILLKLYSPKVLPLTLVDLPGLVRVPTADQCLSICVRIEEICKSYLQNKNAIILAVSAANIDIANSDALQLARTVDPNYERTIGVLTKIDLMDRGTDIVRVLANRVIRLRFGFVPVVCRSQSMTNMSLVEALENERLFFEQHSAYSSKSAYCGTPYLVKKLRHILHAHIKSCVPNLQSRINQQLEKATNELATLGSETTSPREAVLQAISDVGKVFGEILDGSYEWDPSQNSSTANNRLHLKDQLYVETFEFKAPNNTNGKTSKSNNVISLMDNGSGLKYNLSDLNKKYNSDRQHETNYSLFDRDSSAATNDSNFLEKNLRKLKTGRSSTGTTPLYLGETPSTSFLSDSNSSDSSLSLSKKTLFDETKLKGGARLTATFESYTQALDTINPLPISTEKIHTLLKNSTGCKSHILFPQAAFERLASNSILQINPYTKKLVSTVLHEMLCIMQQACAHTAVKRYPLLQEKIAQSLIPMFRNQAEVVIDLVEKLVKWNSEYVSSNKIEYDAILVALNGENNILDGKPEDTNENAIVIKEPTSKEGFSRTTSLKDRDQRNINFFDENSALSKKERTEINILKTFVTTYFETTKRTIVDQVPKAIMSQLVIKCTNNIQKTLFKDVYEAKNIDNLVTESEEVIQRRKVLKGTIDALKHAYDVMCSL